MDPSLVIPLSAQKRNWQALLDKEQAARNQARLLTGRQIVAMLAAVLGLVGMVVLIVVLSSNIKKEQAVAARRTMVLPTAGPTSTFLPTPSPVVRLTEAGRGHPAAGRVAPGGALHPYAALRSNAAHHQ